MTAAEMQSARLPLSGPRNYFIRLRITFCRDLHIYFLLNAVAKKNILYLFALVLFASAGGVCQQSAGGPFKAQIEKAKALRDAGSSDEARKIYESVSAAAARAGPKPRTD